MRLLFVTLVLLVTACAPRGGVATTGGTDEERVPAAWPYALEAPAASASRALVVTDAPLATRVGVDVLRAGGNAVDAAVATAFALAVVYPEAGNIGGGGFMVARMADGSAAALDFREKAPLAATRDMYVDASGQTTDRSLIGHLASGVPGAVKGLFEAHRRFGTKPWPELLAPAIRLADEGFLVDDDFAGSVRDAADRLRRFEASASLFLPGGEPLRAGTRWRNPDLAVVLRRIAERGPAGFYEGETADLIVGEMRRGQGLITHEDLRRYEAKWRDPLMFEYRGNAVLSMPPASSGGITLALIAGIMEGYPLDRMGWHSTQSLHLLAEAMRRAFADRNHFLGDADFVDVPLAQLLSDEYHARLRATIDEKRATPSSAVKAGGPVPPGRPQVDRAPAHAHALANGAVVEGNHTTHFSIVDTQGNAVALTTTINELYGSAVTVTGGGFLLNDEMDDFTSKPGTPNMYGLVQGEANAIVPEKRMLSAMTPTIVVGRDRRVLLVTGARGGPRIISAVFQVMSNVIDHGMDVAAAVDAPRIHHQHVPDVLSFERDGLTEREQRELAALGHNVQAFSGYIGTAPTILRQGNSWTAMPDPRQGGKAEGY
jgi:gamma-glutamyltranspeptidase/glutathione hydrolase